ncbi:zinc knuckle CX2CX4HX4C [Artemisia annua]|uniref:Zinc knuckle CX2CX4HX4C n=1 Tax=Artemisia annua TaxID=35608 RepID=A0A2U1MTV1_ARTAN|nr:zinc knuckle CX2CX4HX4C [Artemisia annua]
MVTTKELLLQHVSPCHIGTLDPFFSVPFTSSTISLLFRVQNRILKQELIGLLLTIFIYGLYICDAPILKSVLRKVVRNFPNEKTNVAATLEKQGTELDSVNDVGLPTSNVTHVVSPTGTSELNMNDKTSMNVVTGTIDKNPGTNDINHSDSVSPNSESHVVGKNVGKHGDSDLNMPNMSTQSSPTPLSFADMLKDKTTKKIVRISEMRNEHCVAGANVTISLEVVDEISSRFANTLYGYFIGKRLAFPIVENYVKNTWAKLGLQRVMLNNGFFFCFNLQPKRDWRGKKWKGNQPARQVDGVRLQKPKVQYYYRPISKPNNGASTSQPNIVKKFYINDNIDMVSLRISFDALSNDNNIFETGDGIWSADTGGTNEIIDVNDDSGTFKDDINNNKDVQVKNNNWVEDINPLDLKKSFKKRDSVSDPVIGSTCTPEVISSSSKTTSPSPSKHTSIVEKIVKLEKLIIDGKATLLDDNGKPIPVADDSDDEVFEPNDPMSSYFSSAGGHNKLEGYLSEDYAAQYGKFSDLFWY